MEPTLAASILFSAFSGVVFVLVGHVIHRRPVSRELRPPRNAFVAWWYGLGAYTLAGGLLNLAAPWLEPRIDLYVSLTVLLYLWICVALWGLMYYLMFLFTDSDRLRWPLAVGYLAYFWLLVYYVLHSGPSHLATGDWAVRLQYERPADGGPLVLALLAFGLVPPMLAALGYLSLVFRVEDEVQRKRILLVSLSILLWFTSGFVGTSPALEESLSWQVTSRLIGLGAAAMIYYAYARLGAPPREPAQAPESRQPVAGPRADEAPARRQARRSSVAG
jgi:hypothetical protein